MPFPWGFAAILELPDYTVEELYNELRAVGFNVEQVVSMNCDQDFGIFFDEYADALTMYTTLSASGGADGILRTADFDIFLFQPHLWKIGDPPQSYPEGVKEVLQWKWPWLVPPTAPPS